MQEIRRKRAIAIEWRARLPIFTRILALVVLIAGIAFVAVSYYKLRNRSLFSMKSQPPELSREVVGRVSGYEQRIARKDGSPFLWLRAATDITYSDGHHELENVNLAVYSPGVEKPNLITGNRAISNKENEVIKFQGNVRIETKEGLKVATELVVYDSKAELAHTDAPLTFERENVSGHAIGAVVTGQKKTLELGKDVVIVVAPEAKAPGAKPASVRSRPVTINAAHALFEQEALKLFFSGGVTAEQERDILSGDNMTATLNEHKRLQKVEVRGNSYLRTMNPGRAAEVHSVDMDFFLDNDQRLQRAIATRDTRARSLDAESEMQMSGANVVQTDFLAQGDQSLLKEMHTEGRSIVTLAAPKSRANDPRASSKRLTADAIKLVWRTNGKDLERSEAVGNAEVYLEPVVSNARTDRKTVTGPRLDCDFYEVGNLAHVCTGVSGVKVVIDPTQPTEKRATRTLTSEKMSAVFVRDTQDLERFEAQGNAKFNELDRNGTAATIVYTAADDTVRLRGGEPTVWDSRARSKGLEMDSDLTHDISYSRGKTATTYYSQEKTNGATPFNNVKSPVYISSDRGEFHHDDGVAIYTGDARAWQDDNFVRSDKLTILVDAKRMRADGHVQSGLYRAKRKEKGVSSIVPVFATAEAMTYSDPDRILHYETNVDIRQGTDRITSGVADVYLQKETNEVERTIAQRNVVLTQPNRKGTGDWVQHTTADQVSVIKGNPARVEDLEQGTTVGNRLTVYSQEGRVIADDARGTQAPGRVHSSHKIRKQ
jgi:lipopolysaccharide export system protein LptA